MGGVWLGVCHDESCLSAKRVSFFSFFNSSFTGWGVEQVIMAEY